jgi:hypothetical protein
VALAAELSGAPRNALYQQALAMRQASGEADNTEPAADSAAEPADPGAAP